MNRPLNPPSRPLTRSCTLLLSRNGTTQTLTAAVGMRRAGDMYFFDLEGADVPVTPLPPLPEQRSPRRPTNSGAAPLGGGSVSALRATSLAAYLDGHHQLCEMGRAFTAPILADRPSVVKD